MGVKAEQLAPHTRSGQRRGRRYTKKVTVRLARRLGKKYLDEAPTRVIRGYAN
jgi:hypothetical protein